MVIATLILLSALFLFRLQCRSFSFKNMYQLRLSYFALSGCVVVESRGGSVVTIYLLVLKIVFSSLLFFALNPQTHQFNSKIYQLYFKVRRIACSFSPRPKETSGGKVPSTHSDFSNDWVIFLIPMYELIINESWQQLTSRNSSVVNI